MAAVDLVKAIEENPGAVFPSEWFRYQAKKLQVRDFIVDICANELEGYFDQAMFEDGIQRVYQLFLDRAINNVPMLHVA